MREFSQIQFGQYVAVCEIHRGPFGSVYAARRADESVAAGVRFIIKTCTPDANVIGFDSARRAVSDFLARYRFQQTFHQKQSPAAASGTGAPTPAGENQLPGGADFWQVGGDVGECWLAVREIGRCSSCGLGDEIDRHIEQSQDGAFVVLDAPALLAGQGNQGAAPITFDWLIRARVSPDAATLKRWVSELARALATTRRTSSRAHGCLKPTNIALVSSAKKPGESSASGMGPGSLEELSIRLTDPGPEMQKGDDERDVRGFSDAVYRLITHQPYLGDWSASSGAGAAWGNLGSWGNGLRKLLESILDPAASSADGRVAGVAIEDLPELIGKLERAGRPRRMLLAGAAAALALGGCLGGYFYYQHLQDVAKGRIVARWLVEPQAAENWKAFCTQYRDWFAFFLRRLDEKPTPAVIAAATGEDGGARETVITTRRDLYKLDPELAKVVSLLSEADVTAGGVDRESPKDPWTMAGVRDTTDLVALGTTPTESAKTDASIVATEMMLELIAKTRDQLVNWNGPNVLKDSSGELAALKWARPAEYIKQLAARLEGEASGQGTLSPDVAGDIDAVVAVRPRVDAIRARWRRITETPAKWAEVDDAVLKRFAGAAAGMVRGMGMDDPDAPPPRATDLIKLDQQLEAIEKLSQSLVEFVENKWPAIDTESFYASAEYEQIVRAPDSVENFDAWMKTAMKHPSLDPALDPRRNAGWTVEQNLAAVDTLKNEFAQEPLDEPLKQAQIERIERLRGEAVAVKKLAWNRRNESRVISESKRLQDEGAELRRVLEDQKRTRVAVLTKQGELVRSNLAARAEIVGTSEAVNSAWRRRRDELLASIEPIRFKNLESQSQNLSSALVELEKQMPAGLLAENILAASGGGDAANAIAGGAWAASIARASIDEREKRLAAFLTGAALDDAGVGRLVATSQDMRSSFADWLESVKTLAGLAATLARLMGLGYMPSEPLPAGVSADSSGEAATIAALGDAVSAHPAMKDPAIASAVKPVVDELAAAKTIALETSSAKLIEQVRSEAGVGRVIAAWQRLMSDAVAFPASQAELESLGSLSGQARAAIERIADPSRRSELALAWIEPRVTRKFVRFVEAAATPTDLEAALAQIAVLKIAPANLPERLRYNLLVFETRRSLAGAKLTDFAAYQAGKKMLNEARAMGSIATSTGVNQTLGAVAALADQPPPEVKRIDPRTLGPGSPVGGGGWEGAEDEATGRLTFSRSDGSRSGKITLEFERVEADTALGVDPFYLATRETSLRVVLGLLDNDAKRQQFLTTLPAYDRDDPSWLGPRVYRRLEGFARTSLMVNDSWMFLDANISEDTPAYAAGLLAPDSFSKLADKAGGTPTTDHPMQRISPAGAAYIARLAGCRFPTSNEWKAAYGALIVSRGLSAGPWNLRDRTFEIQRAHVEEMQSKVQRKASFQWPDVDAVELDPAVPKGQRAQSRQDDDGVLFFLKTGEGNGPLKHMIGNVAEFVFDEPGALEAIEQPTIEAARKAMDANKASLRVIGGSALSPPSVPVDEARSIDYLSATDGFTDVGFRLAFGATGTTKEKPLAVKLLDVLKPEVYLLGK